MNEFEIDWAAERYANDSILGPATRFLWEFKEEVNSHSDGWPYWKPARHSAAKLIIFIQSPRKRDWEAIREKAKQKMFLDSLVPIRAFMTRRGFRAGMRMPSRIGQRDLF